MSPGAPCGGVWLADGIGEVLDASAGSGNDTFEEFEHLLVPL